VAGISTSALGHEQTSRHVRVMSVIPLKADINQRGLHVRLVPLRDMDWGTQFPRRHVQDRQGFIIVPHA
jgi:hypothetical protein